MLNRRQTLAALPLFGAAPFFSRGEGPPKAEAMRKFQLGLVTYNVAAAWDLPTILKVCSKIGIAAVECRTTHKHGIEPGMSADAIKDTKKRFSDSGVKFWGCGTTCEFHSPDAGGGRQKRRRVQKICRTDGGPRRYGREGPPERPADERRQDGRPDRHGPQKVRRRGQERGRRDLRRGPRQRVTRPEVHAHGHGLVRPPVGRRDLELERHGRERGLDRRVVRDAQGLHQVLSYYRLVQREIPVPRPCSPACEASATTAIR